MENFLPVSVPYADGKAESIEDSADTDYYVLRGAAREKPEDHDSPLEFGNALQYELGYKVQVIPFDAGQEYETPPKPLDFDFDNTAGLRINTYEGLEGHNVSPYAVMMRACEALEDVGATRLVPTVSVNIEADNVGELFSEVQGSGVPLYANIHRGRMQNEEPYQEVMMVSQTGDIEFLYAEVELEEDDLQALTPEVEDGSLGFKEEEGQVVDVSEDVVEERLGRFIEVLEDEHRDKQETLYDLNEEMLSEEQKERTVMATQPGLELGRANIHPEPRKVDTEKLDFVV